MEEAPMIEIHAPNKEDLLTKWAMALEQVEPLNKWDLPEELAYFAEYATHCTDILELGAYNGASTKIMLLANPNLRVTVIDLWEDEGTEDTFKNAMEPFRAENRIIAFKDSTENGMKILMEFRAANYDGLLIDAGHTYELVYNDILLGMQLVKPGSLITGHDYHPPWPDNGVSQAVKDLLPGHYNPIASIWAYKIPE
jgi:predicted O-methyltransferase YrrM